MELIYLISLPLALFVFRPLSDRGILLARILGLLAVCWVAWLFVSLEWMDFSRGAVYIGMTVVAASSAAVLWFKRSEIRDFIKARWRLILFGEALFLAAFLAFVAVRYFNPDLWHPYRGGEKPMELAYFTAVFKSTIMPPYDPWFAGRVSELLLLGLLRHCLHQPGGLGRSGHGLQPGRAAVLRIDCHRGVFAGLQPGGGSAARGDSPARDKSPLPPGEG